MSRTGGLAQGLGPGWGRFHRPGDFLPPVDPSPGPPKPSRGRWARPVTSHMSRGHPPRVPDSSGGGRGSCTVLGGLTRANFDFESPKIPLFPYKKRFFLRFCRFFVTTESATLSNWVQNPFSYYMKGWDMRKCTRVVSGCLLWLRLLRTAPVVAIWSLH